MPVLGRLPLFRLAWLQAFKRLPVNLRPLLRVPKHHNPKGLGLFLSGYCNLWQTDPSPETRHRIDDLAQLLVGLQTQGWKGACWGYPFDWQARAFFQPKGTPTVVASTYVGHAMLDAFEITQDPRLLSTARSVCDFILGDLRRTPDDQGGFAFSYSPLDRTQVFNASLLGSRMLARVYHHTREPALAEAARQSVAFCCRRQRPDGAWPYGTLPFHQWVDSFHTGFNLECLAEYERFTGDRDFRPHLAAGLTYYLANFFTPAGQPKYYDHDLYPIDIHAPAQLVITLYRLGCLDEHRHLVERVLSWTIEHMQDPRGFFIYQKGRYLSSRIPYMRWAQAWMFFALTTWQRAMAA